jgi:hypothetical protein
VLSLVNPKSATAGTAGGVTSAPVVIVKAVDVFCFRVEVVALSANQVVTA